MGVFRGQGRNSQEFGILPPEYPSRALPAIAAPLITDGPVIAWPSWYCAACPVGVMLFWWACIVEGWGGR
ncbi:MAG: hypothetical protein BWK76_03255 [Desulfobulbaceae bacterium A2]|nr:MAG: hypothetical protein BWK76_03255 [Desulfobulbaceae bacterium A2]